MINYENMRERKTGEERGRGMQIMEWNICRCKVKSKRNRDDVRGKERGIRRREGKRVAERG